MPKFKIGDTIYCIDDPKTIFIIKEIDKSNYKLLRYFGNQVYAATTYIDAGYEKLEKQPMADIYIASLYNSQTNDSIIMITATDFQKNEVSYRFISGNDSMGNRECKMHLSEFMLYFIKREVPASVTKKDCTCDSKALFDFGCRCGGFKASLNKE